MSWIEYHEASERLASTAQAALRHGQRQKARELYARAADAEQRAVADLDAAKTRTLGISSVSAVSLYYKAAMFERAEEVACRWLSAESVPVFAKEQLRILLQSIWSEQTRNKAPARFEPGEILVSVQGGEIVSGGAPLDLIVEKVKIVQSLFHRTAEFLGGLDHRRRGAPNKEIQDSCRPWLFQAAPGSYQFAVAIQKEYQPDLFEPALPSPGDVADCFMQILRVGIEDPEESFTEVVPDADYRKTFLKLTRNLAPDGSVCRRLDVRVAGDSRPISLGLDVRHDLGRFIREAKRGHESPEFPPEPLHGVLRAVHLDKDWLEVAVEKGASLRRVHAVGEEVDDVLGPLVNKPVIVYVRDVAGKCKFLDIEADSPHR